MVALSTSFATDHLGGILHGASSAAKSTVGKVQRVVTGATGITMDEDSLDVDGLRLNFAISSNALGDDQIWAINIHGYFAGGAMYHRESEQLAASLGWRVVNPSLPGFGGSDPLSWSQISMRSLAERIEALMDHLGIERAVILGHSMGGGVAIEFAARHPERVLGIIYRDGVATPEWQQRRGVLTVAVSSLAPEVGPMVDMAAAVALDIPDLLVGRMLSTIQSLLPDLRRNLKTLARTAPVASMLMEVDQTPQVVSTRRDGVPILCVWGCFDRISNAETAEQFSRISGTDIQWVPGGHSWMLARPSGQRDLLRYVPAGRAFVEQIESRAVALPSEDEALREAN